MSAVAVSRPGEVPVPPRPMSRFAWELYRSLGPLTYPDPENGWVLASLVEAWTTVESWLDDASRPAPRTGEPPWSAVLDPDRCPWWALRWCGQAYGQQLLPILGAWQRPAPEVERRWRRQIADRLGWRRGHPDAILAAALQFMQGQSRVRLRERYDPNQGAAVDAPYHLQVIVRESDLIPGTDKALRQAVKAAVPIGLIVDIAIRNERDWDEVVASYDDWDAAIAANNSWNNLIDGG